MSKQQQQRFRFTCLVFILVGFLGIMFYFKKPQVDIVSVSQNYGTPKRWAYNDKGQAQKYTHLSSTGINSRIWELLIAYGIWNSGDTLAAIKTIARIYRIYPEVLVCVAYSDSSLWKHLKTVHNYGNVWNNDRGNKVSYTNLEQGFNAIWKTLTNKYLWGYISIDQLSRYWNVTGHIYASSIQNWHINIKNCIGMIRNKRIPDNFAFRF